MCHHAQVFRLLLLLFKKDLVVLLGARVLYFGSRFLHLTRDHTVLIRSKRLDWAGVVP